MQRLKVFSQSSLTLIDKAVELRFLYFYVLDTL